MLVANAVVDTDQPRLQVGENQMDDRQVLLGNLWITTLGNSEVLIAALRADPRTCDSSTRGWRCQTPEHDADHGETDEGDNGSGITLEVAGEAPVAADPGERSLHDPAFRQGHEAVRVGALTISSFQQPVVATVAAILGPW